MGWYQRGAHLRKMTKNRQKTYQKEHPAPQKLNFCNKKSVIFTQKDHPAPLKTQVLLEKMPKKRQKDDPKKEKPPLKPEVLHEKIKIVLPMVILKKKISTPNLTKLLNP